METPQFEERFLWPSLPTAEVLETESNKQSPEELFQELLEQMPENMRLFEELRNRRGALYDSVQSHQAKLANLDIEKPAQSYSAETAFDALKLLLTDRKLKAVDDEMREMDRVGDWLKFIDMYGRRSVRLEPLGDAKMYFFNDEGAFMSSSSKPKEGILKRIRLTPSDGGYIEFKGKGKLFRGFDRRADPLFDKNTYEPRFRIEFL